MVMTALNHQSHYTGDETVIERAEQSNIFSQASFQTELERQPENQSPNQDHTADNRTTSDFGASQFDNRLSGLPDNRISGLPVFNEMAQSARNPVKKPQKIE